MIYLYTSSECVKAYSVPHYAHPLVELITSAHTVIPQHFVHALVLYLQGHFMHAAIFHLP